MRDAKPAEAGTPYKRDLSLAPFELWRFGQALRAQRSPEMQLGNFLKLLYAILTDEFF
jgi:hypothetical protein